MKDKNLTDSEDDLEDEFDDDIKIESALNLPDHDRRIIGWGVIFAVVAASLILYFR
ncbi:hypothetical protein KAJ89_01265 [Candidatus Parcubacteria bacterium]|nr:hypothetical protein [Candidatus Parcubacteria bacterium]